jgi:hypothetical protein
MSHATYGRSTREDEDRYTRPGREPATDRYQSFARQWDESEETDRRGARRWLGRTAMLVALAVALLGGAGYGAIRIMDGSASESTTSIDTAATPDPPTYAAPTFPDQPIAPPTEPSAGVGPVGPTSPTQGVAPPTPPATATKPAAPKPCRPATRPPRSSR